MERYAVLYFDGSYKHVEGKHPVSMCAWIAEIGGDFSVTAFDAVTSKQKTSNRTEWQSLINGLEWLKAMSPFSHIDIRGDSLSIIECLLDREIARKNADCQFAHTSFVILDQITNSYNATKVTRTENAISHALAQKVMSSKEKCAIVSQIKKSTLPTITVKALAEYLWRSAGCPNGQDLNFWLAAEKYLAKIC